uniref:Uncharacterized protein n=1 Tax=Phage sp. ctKtV17 TaxID=2825792 RepID=A0A8S5UYA4_9VIRU|nr:MAG TPA: hypothetical protein [Phage sp. ctKtV17]
MVEEILKLCKFWPLFMWYISRVSYFDSTS